MKLTSTYQYLHITIDQIGSQIPKGGSIISNESTMFEHEIKTLKMIRIKISNLNFTDHILVATNTEFINVC